MLCFSMAYIWCAIICCLSLVQPQVHIGPLEESEESRLALLMGLDYLLNISFVNDDEVFKICLDYWNFFVPDVYVSVTTGLSHTAAYGSPQLQFGGPGTASAPGVLGAAVSSAAGSTNAGGGRRLLYSQVLSRLRLLMISRMAKPEEVSLWWRVPPQSQHLHVAFLCITRRTFLACMQGVIGVKCEASTVKFMARVSSCRRCRLDR